MNENALASGTMIAPEAGARAVSVKHGAMRGSERIALLCQLIVMLIGTLAILGWTTGYDLLTRALPGHSSLNTSTSAGLVLLAVSLALTALGRFRVALRGPASVLAFVVLLASSWRLVSEIAEHSSGAVPRVHATNPLGAFDRFLDTLPPNSAVGLLLLSLASLGWAWQTRRLVVLAQALAVGVLFLALLTLAGHLFGASSLYELEPGSPMGYPTALAFCLLSVGLLSAGADRGLMRVVTGPGLAGTMARRLLPACVLMPLIVAVGIAHAAERGSVDAQSALALTVILISAPTLGLIWYHAGVLDRSEQRRQQSDEALRRSELFYHTLVETLPQCIIRKDVDGHFTFVNQRFCETIAQPAEDLLSQTDHDLFPTALAEKYRRDDQRVMRERAPLDMIEQHVTPDGEEHYVHVIKSPLMENDGRLIGVQVIFWDVTSEIRAERRLVEQNEQLRAMAESERRAHEDRKLAQARLIQSAKLAGVGQVVAGVAHEINNPLAFVSNNVAVLERDLADLRALLEAYREAKPLLAAHAPELQARIERISEQADLDYVLENMPGLINRTRDGLDRIRRIVTDLRAFARMDEDAFMAVDIAERIRATTHILDGRARHREVSLVLNLAELPLIECRPGKLDQVVMNLVANAIEACGPGGRVDVRAWTELDRLLIEVADNGCGIDAETRERIFDPFFTTKAVGEGTGLGLSLTYGIVRDHGGTIEVESAPGQGARFRVVLPMTRRDGQERLSLSHASTSSGGHPTEKQEEALH